MNNSPLESHKIEQMLENVRFLESVGLSREAIARRLGVTEDALEKAIARERQRSSHCEAQEV